MLGGRERGIVVYGRQTGECHPLFTNYNEYHSRRGIQCNAILAQEYVHDGQAHTFKRYVRTIDVHLVVCTKAVLRRPMLHVGTRESDSMHGSMLLGGESSHNTHLCIYCDV